MTKPPSKKPLSLLKKKLTKMRSIHDTQRIYIRNELLQARGLLPILLKRRNGGKWTPEERASLRRDLRALSNLSPYLLPLILPGGILLLPVLAWWLDSRRKTREKNTKDEK